MIEQNFIELFEKSFRKNWDLPGLEDYQDGNSYTYGELAAQISKLHILFKEFGIQKGDKVALIGKNHTSWGIVFLGTITYGAVIVPILHEFNPESMENIIEHSESKLVFINGNIWNKLSIDNTNINVIEIPTFELLKTDSEETSKKFLEIDKLFSETYPNGFSKEDIKYPYVDNSELACLNYTSGTTGFSKGVMISANNYASILTWSHKQYILLPGERILAFLPLAHTYGCAFDFLYALSEGVHVTLLGIQPTPQNIIKAFAKIKPNLIISVPLILEKIYKKRILPVIETPKMRLLLKIPVIREIIHKKIKEQLTTALGGNFREVIMGGAPLSREVEDFFHKIKFPYTVGYGMTECAPLISYTNNTKYIPTSCGSVLDKVMDARIDSPDGENIPGEIQVKGENVMMGYYKNPEATKATFTEDGWLKTGDFGIMKGKTIFIKGRIKTMILRANGQNIYPEEIEAKFNNLSYVQDSLVIDKDQKLIALIYPDYASLKENDINSPEAIDNVMKENLDRINNSLSRFEKIAYIELMKNEFEKTPKHSIKRYLYQD